LTYSLRLASNPDHTIFPRDSTNGPNYADHLKLFWQIPCNRAKARWWMYQNLPIEALAFLTYHTHSARHLSFRFLPERPTVESCFSRESCSFCSAPMQTSHNDVETHSKVLITVCNSPTNALVCNKTLIQMSHIKTLKSNPTCFDHQMIIIRELLDPG
jgi:hypothetical protein